MPPKKSVEKSAIMKEAEGGENQRHSFKSTRHNDGLRLLVYNIKYKPVCKPSFFFQLNKNKTHLFCMIPNIFG